MPSSNYKRDSFEMLKALYPRLSVRAIERAFKVEHGYHFTDAFNALLVIGAMIPIVGTEQSENDIDVLRARILREAPYLENVNQIVLKYKRAPSNRLPRTERLDHGLVLEMSHIPQLNHVVEKENLLPPSHQGRPKEADDDDEDGALYNNGETVECGCCMDDILVTEMVHCRGTEEDAFSIHGSSSRHYFCKTCFQRHFNEQLHGKNQSHVPCMSMAGCDNTFAEDQFAAALSPRAKKNYDIRLVQEEVKKAGVDVW
jgi:hypothetical protein